MSHKRANRAQVTSSSTGTGPLVLDSQTVGFYLFSSFMSNGDTCYILIENPGFPDEEEQSLATYNNGTLTRTYDQFSKSHTGQLIALSPGIKTVSMCDPAGVFPAMDPHGNAAIQGDLTVEGGKRVATANADALRARETAYGSYSGLIPADDTKPQIGEGNRLFLKTFTALNDEHSVQILAQANVSTAGGADTVCMALFVNGATDAVAAEFFDTSAANKMALINIDWTGIVPFGANTYEVRFGATSRVTWLNGTPSTRLGGGTQAAIFSANEVETPPVPHLRNVGTRNRWCNETGAHQAFMSRFTETIRANDVVGLQVVFPNFIVLADTGETGSGGTAKIQAKLEYPSGTFHDLLFSTSLTGTINDVSYLASDILAIAPPAGANVWIWVRWEGTKIILGPKQNHSIGDRYQYGDSIPLSALSWSGGNISATVSTAIGTNINDYFAIAGASPAGYNGIYQCTGKSGNTLTAALVSDPGANTVLGVWTQTPPLSAVAGVMDIDAIPTGGTIPPADTITYMPVALNALTLSDGVIALGDSRDQGNGDRPDSTGDQGNVCRSLGPVFGYLNGGVDSESMQNFLDHPHTNRVALGNAYYNKVILQWGINDISDGDTLLEMIANQTTIAALFPGKSVFGCTTECVSSSSNFWVNQAGQTTAIFNAARVAWNNYLRAGPDYLKAVFDLANVTEYPTDSGIWIAPTPQGSPVMTAGGYEHTADGTHLSQDGYIYEKTSGAINTDLIATL